MKLFEIASACGGKIFYNREDALQEEKLNKEATGVVLDSRKVLEDYVFIATRGERVDGHSFIDQVFEKGALGVVCEELPENPAGPCILVEDSFKALKAIATEHRNRLSIPIVGITGSVGKTSTKEFIASVLATKYKVQKTIGNFNNEIGLPLTLLTIGPEHTAAVVEMGISDFGEMHRLSSMAKPDICVITNIGQCHLEFLHDRDGILRAKSEIFDYMNPQGTICLNGDDDKLCGIQEVKGIKPFFFGKEKSNSVYADEIVNKGLFGSECRIHTPKGEFTASIPLPGLHMVYNALAATAVGLQLSLSLSQIAEGIAAVKPLGGRSNIMRLAKGCVIDDCYNASPASMKGAVDLLGTALSRRVAVLGDMLELGEREADLHTEVGAYCTPEKVDLLLCIGSRAKDMYDAAVKQIPANYYETRDELEKALPGLLEPGDTILVKASHGIGLSHVVEMLEELLNER